MSEKYQVTDLNIPDVLINYYYVSGCICVGMNSFVIYLLLYRKGKLDTFRYYLLVFQLVPFFPFIIGGFAIGAFPSLSLLSPHYCMTILSFLVGFQINMLTICFLRKHRVISKVSGKFVLTKRVFHLIAISCIMMPFTYSVPFHLTRNTREEKLEIIDSKYPLLRARFEQLTNFEVYEFTIWMKIFSAMVMVGCVHAVSIVTVLAYQMYTALVLCSASLSKDTLEKHKSRLKSLIGQFLTTPIAVLPSVFIVLTIVVPFEGAQIFSWYMLMVMTTHSTINCLVVIFTIPEFRAFVLFWSEEGKKYRKRVLISRPTSLVSTRTARHTFLNTMS